MTTVDGSTPRFAYSGVAATGAHTVEQGVGQSVEQILGSLAQRSAANTHAPHTTAAPFTYAALSSHKGIFPQQKLPLNVHGIRGTRFHYVG